MGVCGYKRLTVMLAMLPLSLMWPNKIMPVKKGLNVTKLIVV